MTDWVETGWGDVRPVVERRWALYIRLKPELQKRAVYAGIVAHPWVGNPGRPQTWGSRAEVLAYREAYCKALSSAEYIPVQANERGEFHVPGPLLSDEGRAGDEERPWGVYCRPIDEQKVSMHLDEWQLHPWDMDEEGIVRFASREEAVAWAASGERNHSFWFYEPAVIPADGGHPAVCRFWISGRGRCHQYAHPDHNGRCEPCDAIVVDLYGGSPAVRGVFQFNMPEGWTRGRP